MKMSVRHISQNSSELGWDAGGVLRFASRSFEIFSRIDLTDRLALAREIWKESRFREAVFLASRGLYERIEACGPDFQVDEETAGAVLRYYLRSCFRPTPYGGFAGVSYFSAESRARTEITIPTDSDQILRVGMSGEFMRSVADYARATALRSGLRVYLNDTLSKNETAYRFIAGSSGKDKILRYRSVELERSEDLDSFVTFVSVGRSYSEIVDYFQQGADGAAGEAAALADQLLDEQLICTDGLCDLTASDPLASLLSQCPDDGSLRSDLERVGSVLGSSVDVVSKTHLLEEISDSLSIARPRSGMLRADLVDSRDSCGVIAFDELASLKEVIMRLAEHQGRGGAISTFAKNFESRFGDTRVPLTDLLEDLPYLGFSGKEVPPPLVAGLPRRKEKARKVSAVIESAFQAAMKGSTGLYVDFSKHLPAERVEQPADDRPPLVAWVSLWQEASSDKFRLELKSLGRQDPGRVMGRFADSLPGLATYLRNDAAALQKTGLEVVEIVHATSDNSANIVSRPELANSELRIRGGNPPGKKSKQLKLDDLCVSVVQGRIMITLADDGREVALRMSNAHAFIRSYGLPVYKFLNSVSNQSSVIEIPSLRGSFPNLAFAPGLLYNDVIVSRPTWRASDSFWKKLGKERGPGALRYLREELDLFGFPEWITVAQRDNVIPFNTKIDWMMEEVLRMLRLSDETLISDMLPNEMTPALRSDAGYHFHEIQIAVRKLRSDGQTGSIGKPVSLFHEEVLVAPGDGWTFLKIYCPASHQNAVISEIFSHIGGMCPGSHGSAFYIRYSDQTGPHIRLRVRRESEIAGANVENSVVNKVSQLWRQGAIGTFTISPYTREASRYGGIQACKVCEEIFCADSEIAMRQIQAKDERNYGFWIDVARSVDSYLFGTGVIKLEDRLDFATRAAREFSMEHNFGVAENKWIGTLHRNSRQALRDFSPIQEIDNGHPYSWLSALWERFVALAEVGTSTYAVRWSLIHMHMNRVFSKEHRLQEAVVWELLKRSYVTILKQSKIVEPHHDVG